MPLASVGRHRSRQPLPTAVGRTRPRSILIVAVLPAPFGPMNPHTDSAEMASPHRPPRYPRRAARSHAGNLLTYSSQTSLPPATYGGNGDYVGSASAAARLVVA